MVINSLNKELILGSGSPRRSELLKALGFNFSVVVKPVEESFDATLPPAKIAESLALKKGEAFSAKEFDDKIVLTADTIVVHHKSILNKPANYTQAFEMLTQLSGNKHQVITGVCIQTKNIKKVFSSVTTVEFEMFSDDEIKYYIENFKPFDKAGSYGIQEWIGHVGVKSINGCYNNVIGLPTSKVYRVLKQHFFI